MKYILGIGCIVLGLFFLSFNNRREAKMKPISFIRSLQLSNEMKRHNSLVRMNNLLKTKIHAIELNSTKKHLSKIKSNFTWTERKTLPNGKKELWVYHAKKIKKYIIVNLSFKK